MHTHTQHTHTQARRSPRRWRRSASSSTSSATTRGSRGRSSSSAAATTTRSAVRGLLRGGGPAAAAHRRGSQPRRASHISLVATFGCTDAPLRAQTNAPACPFAPVDFLRGSEVLQLYCEVRGDSAYATARWRRVGGELLQRPFYWDRVARALELTPEEQVCGCGAGPPGPVRLCVCAHGLS